MWFFGYQRDDKYFSTSGSQEQYPWDGLENRVKARLDYATPKMHLNFYDLHELLLRLGGVTGKRSSVDHPWALDY